MPAVAPAGSDGEGCAVIAANTALSATEAGATKPLAAAAAESAPSAVGPHVALDEVVRQLQSDSSNADLWYAAARRVAIQAVIHVNGVCVVQ